MRLLFCVLALAVLAISGAADRVDDLIFDMLYSGNPETRLEAAETLGRYGGPRVVEPMIVALNDTWDSSMGCHNDNVRKTTMFGRDVTYIETCGQIRERAAITLGESNDSRAVEPLIVALYNNKGAWKIELAIVEALGKLNDTRAIDSLIDAFETDGMFGARDGLVRAATVRVLANFSDPRTIETLTYIAKNDEDPDVRAVAVVALEKLES